jgi:hypothetical protein
MLHMAPGFCLAARRKKGKCIEIQAFFATQRPGKRASQMDRLIRPALLAKGGGHEKSQLVFVRLLADIAA